LCLSFFWPSLERQIIIKGIAEKVPANTSDGYFESRPLGSQLGAIVSPQSEVIPSREYLEEHLHALEKQYEEVRCSADAKNVSGDSFCRQEERRLFLEIQRIKDKLRGIKE